MKRRAPAAPPDPSTAERSKRLERDPRVRLGLFTVDELLARLSRRARDEQTDD